MTQSVVSKLSVQMGIAHDWMERHPNLHPGMRRNIRKFLENQAELHPDLKAWAWLTRTFKEFADIRRPFGWIKKVLANPWMKMPGEAWIRKPSEGEEGRGKEEELQTEQITQNTSSLIPSPPSRDPKAEAMWGLAKERVKGQITRPAYQTWLADVVGIANEGGRFVLGVPSAFVGDWLAQRMYGLLQRVVSDVIGEEVEIDFTLSPVSEG